MIKSILLIFLALSLSRASANDIKVNMIFSKPLAVFIFIENISTSNGENVFKEEFEKSRFNDAKFKELISEYQKLYLDYSYTFNGYPAASKLGGSTRNLLRSKLVISKDLNDFKQHSIGIIPNSELYHLSEIINQFIPVYDELIYNPNKIRFEENLAKLAEYAATHKLDELINTGLIFYNSNWDESVPFHFAFYPYPNSESFTAEAFGNSAISAIPNEWEDFDILMSVMLHEIYHILYNEQSLEFKNELRDLFQKNNSKSSTYSYLLLNEALATACGNGYVFQYLNGKLDPESWYNRSYINEMGKKIFPLVNEYMASSKKIDQEFVNQYIEIYETQFPNWVNEIDNHMAFRYVLSTNIDDFDEMEQLYPYASNTIYEDVVDKNSIKELKEMPISKVLIISGDNKNKLNSIKNTFPELKNTRFKSKKEFAFTIFLDDKTQLYIFNRQTSSLSDLFQKLNY